MSDAELEQLRKDVKTRWAEYLNIAKAREFKPYRRPLTNRILATFDRASYDDNPFNYNDPFGVEVDNSYHRYPGMRGREGGDANVWNALRKSNLQKNAMDNLEKAMTKDGYTVDEKKGVYRYVLAVLEKMRRTHERLGDPELPDPPPLNEGEDPRPLEGGRRHRRKTRRGRRGMSKKKSQRRKH